MFIDASAVVSIIQEEAGFAGLVQRIEDSADPPAISPLVRLEATLAIARQRSAKASLPRSSKAQALKRAQLAVEALVRDMGAREISITPEIGVAAIEASAKYGKAVGHAAKLNFGDCFAYACAKELGVGLLYKGDDFAKTDLA